MKPTFNVTRFLTGIIDTADRWPKEQWNDEVAYVFYQGIKPVAERFLMMWANLERETQDQFSEAFAEYVEYQENSAIPPKLYVGDSDE